MSVPGPLSRSRAPAFAALLVLPWLLLVGACAAPTPYQPAADGYGYSAQQLESNRYRVTFSGNAVTPRTTVQNYLLYRAAEVTLESGHDYFSVVDQDLERSTRYYGSGIDHFGFSRFHHPHSFGGIGLGSYSAYPVDSYTAFADIVVGEGEKPAGELNAYDARDVLRQLAPTVELPRGA